MIVCRDPVCTLANKIAWGAGLRVSLCLSREVSVRTVGLGSIRNIIIVLHWLVFYGSPANCFSFKSLALFSIITFGLLASFALLLPGQ